MDRETTPETDLDLDLGPGPGPDFHIDHSLALEIGRPTRRRDRDGA